MLSSTTFVCSFIFLFKELFLLIYTNTNKQNKYTYPYIHTYILFLSFLAFTASLNIFCFHKFQQKHFFSILFLNFLVILYRNVNFVQKLLFFIFLLRGRKYEVIELKIFNLKWSNIVRRKLLNKLFFRFFFGKIFSTNINR